MYSCNINIILNLFLHSYSYSDTITDNYNIFISNKFYKKDFIFKIKSTTFLTKL